MKKTTLTTLFLMAALTLSGCHNNQPAPAPQPPEDDPAPPVVSTVKPPQYYFIASHFMGSYDAEGWHSARGRSRDFCPPRDGTESSQSLPERSLPLVKLPVQRRISSTLWINF